MTLEKLNMRNIYPMGIYDNLEFEIQQQRDIDDGQRAERRRQRV